MATKRAEITVNVDAKCPTCGKKGAVVREDGGLNPCLKCVTKAMTERAPQGKAKAPDWARCRPAEAMLPALRGAHPHLEDARIVCLMGPLGGGEGCKTLGRAKRPTATQVALIEALGAAPPDYVLEVDAEQWAMLVEPARRALLDHELCHMAGQDEEGRWGLRGHDLEEFLPVLQRHGAWRPILRDFCKVAQQLDLGL